MSSGIKITGHTSGSTGPSPEELRIKASEIENVIQIERKGFFNRRFLHTVLFKLILY